MLPFLDPKKAVGVIVARRNKGHLHEVSPEVDAPEHESNHELEMACESLLKAIDERSVKGMVSALEDAFDAYEAKPHEEGEHDASDEG